MPGPWKLRGYVVEELLGSGGCADVWRGRVAGGGEPVALKRIVVDAPERVRRANTEAALLCALDHPHLVRLHSLVPTDDAVVLVLDLADGGSLADLLAARGRLTPGEVITAVAPVAAALAYLHGESVVHGDVSAANILFTDAGTPLLADVGVARLTGDDADAESTPAYVDPAVVVGGIPGPQSDVFMLGGVALHALTGAPTWPAETADAALALAARGAPQSVGERLARAGVPDAMTAVICRALSGDPHRRGTAADFALDLRHSGKPVAVELAAGRPREVPRAREWAGPRHAAAPVLAGAEPPTRMVGPRPRPELPPPRRSRLTRWAVRRHTARLALLALVAAAAAAAATWAWRSDASGPGAGMPRAAVAGNRDTAHRSIGDEAMPARREAGPTDWEQTLAGLDAVRAKAFATRDPHLLQRVYVPGPLLIADTALLARIVPPGCGLVGAHTRYDRVQVAVHGTMASVTARARLSASRLVCHARPSGVAPSAGPTILHLTLRRTVDGSRIESQELGYGGQP